MNKNTSKTSHGIIISPVENSNILLLNNEGFDGFRNTPSVYIHIYNTYVDI